MKGYGKRQKKTIDKTFVSKLKEDTLTTTISDSEQQQPASNSGVDFASVKKKFLATNIADRIKKIEKIENNVCLTPSFHPTSDSTRGASSMLQTKYARQGTMSTRNTNRNGYVTPLSNFEEKSIERRRILLSSPNSVKNQTSYKVPKVLKLSDSEML